MVPKYRVPANYANAALPARAETRWKTPSGEGLRSSAGQGDSRTQCPRPRAPRLTANEGCPLGSVHMATAVPPGLSTARKPEIAGGSTINGVGRLVWLWGACVLGETERTRHRARRWANDAAGPRAEVGGGAVIGAGTGATGTTGGSAGARVGGASAAHGVRVGGCAKGAARVGGGVGVGTGSRIGAGVTGAGACRGAARVAGGSGPRLAGGAVGVLRFFLGFGVRVGAVCAAGIG